jgi:hypothetical protein
VLGVENCAVRDTLLPYPPFQPNFNTSQALTNTHNATPNDTDSPNPSSPYPPFQSYDTHT